MKLNLSNQNKSFDSLYYDHKVSWVQTELDNLETLLSLVKVIVMFTCKLFKWHSFTNALLVNMEDMTIEETHMVLGTCNECNMQCFYSFPVHR